MYCGTMESTELSLPSELPFPITICSLDVHPPAEISRGSRLLTYSFTYLSHASGSSEQRFGTGTWDSPIEGSIDLWKVKPGDIIPQKLSRDPVVLVKEPCKHGMQVGGLCGLCGKDMTDFDYTGFSNASRANIQMTHSAKGPTVSLEEAQRFERETAVHLLKSRKLSLIVDLDQTIVHATVDPTVGEWIAEGEAWDNKEDQGDAKDDGEAALPQEVNPNWEALKDVKKFRLGTEGVAPRTSFQSRLDAQGCMYYIKPRPGLQAFLHRMSDKYEMHVYTMGTRAYAEAVCATIDPNGDIFRSRILSRDESGSHTQKSLQRLFPCDTSMVVIIDDRADVWEWSPNLLKVRPYDFFVGIGDINSTFLPKAPSLVPTTLPGRPSLPRSASPVQPASSKTSSEDAEAEADAAFASQNRITIERIAAQVEERPLAKKQEMLEDGAKAKAKEEDGKSTVNGEKLESEEDKTEKVHTAPKKALLKNDDTELDRVSNLLDEVHKRFFDAYDARLPDNQRKQHKVQLPDGIPWDGSIPYDVKAIIPRIRAETLAGAHILFSSVIPLDIDPPMSEVWRTAEVFGAKCHMSLSNQVTHVVAAKRGTIKVDAARRQGGIYIVWLSWFLDSLALWRRQDEQSYLIDADPVTNTGTSSPWQAGENIAGAEGDGELLTPDEDIWADANAEVDAVLEETDDEDEGKSFLAEDDNDDSGWRTDGSTRSTGSAMASPKLAGAGGKKRARSSSVSDPEGVTSRVPRRAWTGDDDSQSPLAKRKKLSAARKSSRLKVGLVANHLSGMDDGGDMEAEAEGDQYAESEEREEQEQEHDSVGSTDGNGENDGDDDDDFLARELEEEAG